MRSFESDRRVTRVLFVLSVAQVIGWGTVSLIAVVSRKISADLHLSISSVFAGTSVLFFTMGVCSPMLTGAFTRFGAKRVMMVGTIISAMGFIVLSVSHEAVLYFAAWVALGVAGSATLTTAAHIMLNEVAGKKAATAIATLMLVTGLYATIFWPLTSFLSDLVGWRGMCLVYAGSMILICLPLYAFGLPPRPVLNREANTKAAASTAASPSPLKGTLYLVIAAISLNAFITVGFSSVLIELLKTEGLSPTDALAFGSALGVIQISARAINVFGGKHWDGITMGLVSTAVLSVSMLLMMESHGSYWAIVSFILLYGLSSGALAVARSTVPLVFYDKAEFAKALSRIALPLNFFSAISAPILIGLMTRFGGNAVLSISLLCSGGAFLALLILTRHRPSAEGAVAS